MVEAVQKEAPKNSVILCMSNGSFGDWTVGPAHTNSLGALFRPLPWDQFFLHLNPEAASPALADFVQTRIWRRQLGAVFLPEKENLLRVAGLSELDESSDVSDAKNPPARGGVLSCC